MQKIIEIKLSIEEIEKRQERISRVRKFQTPDRVPVIPAIAHRFLIPQMGVQFRQYYSDPEIMLKTQILAQKWVMENIKTDAYSITGAWVGAWTDFQNTFEAGSLGCEVVFPENDIPWVGPGWVKNEQDLLKLEQFDFIHTGLNARQLDFREQMIKLAEKYPVRFQGGDVFYPGHNPALTHTSDGPFGVAGDLMGITEIFTAVYERPEFVRELLSVVTDKIIDYLDHCWAVENLPSPKDFAWTDDLAVSLSEEIYRELVLPFEKKLRFHFDGYVSLHMCGKSDHLLKIFLEELKINELQGFGYQVDLDYIADLMGGKVVLIGNVDPMLVQNGTPDQIIKASREVIEKLAPFKGFILQDGNNIPPGSPVENINAMMQAAEVYGKFQK